MLKQVMMIDKLLLYEAFTSLNRIVAVLLAISSPSIIAPLDLKSLPAQTMSERVRTQIHALTR
jgi:hypothetical protein